jgi:hypothetical protein
MLLPTAHVIIRPSQQNSAEGNKQVTACGSEKQTEGSRQTVNKRQDSRRLRSEGGQAAIEFAYTITVTLLLMFGLIDFSRAIYAASVIQWAAQQGARTGIVDIAEVTDAEIISAVEARMVGINVAEAEIQIQRLPDDIMQVDIDYEFEFLIPLVSRITGESITLTASASMVAQ